MRRIPVRNLHLGGIAESEYTGIKFSVSEIVGLDVRSVLGKVKVHQKLTKISGTTIDGFVKVTVECSDGNTYAFDSGSGKIWKIESDDTVTLVHTTTPAAGGAGCLGAEEYNGRIWWFTESRAHYIPIAGLSDWAANAVEDAETFSITDSEYHPTLIRNGILYIGDGYYVAEIDGTTFTADALDLRTPNRIKCLGPFAAGDILIGTFINTNINYGGIFRWDTYSPSWATDDAVEEVGVNAFIPFDNAAVVSAGVNGNFYYYDGQSLQPLKTIPGVYDDENQMTVHPNAVGNFQGVPVFGISQDTGTPTNMGVYSLGRKNLSVPQILSLDFPISQRGNGGSQDLVLDNIEIGAISIGGNRMLVFWKDSNDTPVYGCDKLDWDNKLDGAYFATRQLQPDRSMFTEFMKYCVNYVSLPASTDISIAHDRNYAGSFTTFDPVIANPWDSDEQTGLNQKYAEEAMACFSLKLKVTLTVNGDDAPELEPETLDIFIQDEQK